MSDRKITAPGPGWRMPGKAQSTNIRDAMPNLLNAMGDSIERSNKMDFGTPGIHTQNGFQQPHESASHGPIWALLTDSLPSGTYDTPSKAYGKILFGDESIGENALREGTEDILVWNYSQNFSASAGDWVMALQFGRAFVVIPSSGGVSCNRVRFQVMVSDSVTRTALCAIVSRPYGCSESSVPGTVLNGDAIECCDPAGCFFNDPNDELEGREGWAEYMIPIAGSTFCQDGSYEIVPEWQVYSLCCKTDRCNL